jgi:hypothetical protein
MSVKSEFFIYLLIAQAIAKRIGGVRVESHMPLNYRNTELDDSQDEDEEGESMAWGSSSNEEEEEPEEVGINNEQNSLGANISGLEITGNQKAAIDAEKAQFILPQNVDDNNTSEEGIDGDLDDDTSQENENIFIDEERSSEIDYQNQMIRNSLDFVEFQVNHVQQLMIECIKNQFTEDLMASIRDVKEFCVGLTFQVLFENYQQGLRSLREIILELLRVKFGQLPKYYEPEIDFFLNLLEQFIDKDISLPKSLKTSKRTSKYLVNSTHYDKLLVLAKPEIDAFNEIHDRIKQARNNLAKLLEEEASKQEGIVDNLESQSDVIKQQEEEAKKTLEALKYEDIPDSEDDLESDDENEDDRVDSEPLDEEDEIDEDEVANEVDSTEKPESTLESTDSDNLVDPPTEASPTPSQSDQELTDTSNSVSVSSDTTDNTNRALRSKPLSKHVSKTKSIYLKQDQRSSPSHIPKVLSHKNSSHGSSAKLHKY